MGSWYITVLMAKCFFRSEAKLELIDAKSQKLEAAIDFQKKIFEF